MKKLLVLLALFFAPFTLAQTVDQVAAEVDAVEVDLAAVNGKADTAKSKADAVETKQLGIEQRVTILESLPTVDPSIDGRVTAVEASNVDHAARITSLEANPGGVTQSDHDALASRVTALEASPVSKYVARDSLGSFVADWFDRSAVGVAFMMVNYGSEEIRVRIEPSRLTWTGVRASTTPSFKLYANGLCVGSPMVQTSRYTSPDLSSDDFFGGYIEGEIEIESGVENVYRFDTSQVVTISGDTYKRDGDRCQFAVRNPDVYVSTFAFSLPQFVAPFTIAQE